jgi:hypothetical protein
MSNINHLVDRFLSWPLPKSVCADPCASNPDYPDRSGTNLLNAEQAHQMLEHILGPAVPERLQGLSPKIVNAQLQSGSWENFCGICRGCLAATSSAAQPEPVGEAYLCDKCQTPFDGAHYCPSCGHNTATKEPVWCAKGNGKKHRTGVVFNKPL